MVGGGGATNKKFFLDIKNFGTKMKHDFDGLISRLDTAEESLGLRIYINRNLKNYKAKRTKTEKQTQIRISKDCWTATKGIAYT